MKKQDTIKVMLTGFLCAGILLIACDKKDYIVGEEIHDINLHKNTSTYDMLKGNQSFDTLIQVIDAAGLKDAINAEGVTFFAPHDLSIYSYLSMRTLMVQALYDKNKKFGLDSLLFYLTNNINNTKDSLKLYLVGKPLTYENMTEIGTIYETQLPGDTIIVSYEQISKDAVDLGYTPSVSGIPRLVYFTHLWYHYDLSPVNPAAKVPNSIGVRTLVKTSGILTKNGMVHALTPASHTLFFYGTKR
jgi:hypothetical protein